MKKITRIYLFSIIIYGIIILLFTSTVHVEVDEELYLSLAKSFHYLGRFEMNGEIANYNCVLYSMLISIAYYFYNPRTLLFTMRLINVVLMCSSIFPIWLLASKVLRCEKKAMNLCLLSMMMPYMFDSAYIMQENLSYPLFLWTVYFGYCAFEEKTRSRILPAAVLAALCFFTKTYLLSIPIVVNICFVMQLKNVKEIKESVKRIAFYDCVYLCSVVAAYIFVYLMNGGMKGENHYSNQLSGLFPVTGWTVVSAIIGIVVFGCLFLLNTGVLPIPAILYYKKRFQKCRWFFDFTILSCVVLIMEIVILVVIPLEGVPTIPHKFQFRHFNILVPLILILYTEVMDEIEFLRNRRVQKGIYLSIVLVICYFIIIQGKTRQAIMDGHVFLLLENASKYVMRYADVLAVILIGIAFTFLLFQLKKKKKWINTYHKACIAFVLMFWLLNCVQLPYYTNYVAEGKQIQDDSIKIAEYLNEKDYEQIYYVYENTEEKSSYLRNFYGYIRQPYQIIAKADALNLISENNDCKIAFLLSSNANLLNDCQEIQMVDLNNENLLLYILQ